MCAEELDMELLPRIRVRIVILLPSDVELRIPGMHQPSLVHDMQSELHPAVARSAED
jgi:hypothetical protein